MNSVEYYLARGLDRRTAEVFAAGRRTIVKATPEKDFTILLDFDNGERRRLDMRPDIRQGTVFSFLADPAVFLRAYLDESHCVCWDKDPAVDSGAVWSNKVDISPETCYLDSVPVPSE